MYVERDIQKKFEKIVGSYPIVAVVGARQAGKTTFLKEKLKGKNSSYLLFDDPDIMSLFEKDIKEFETQFIEGKEISVLDEIHYCKDSGKKLKYLADIGRKLWVTSSSEIILSKEVLSYLVGRVSVLKLYPFSLKEFLVSKSEKNFTEKVIQRNIKEHLIYGGYPKVVLTKNIGLKKIMLLDLYNTMILKDIALTFSINDVRSLEEFSKYLSLNIGNVISYETLANDLNLSFKSIKKYLDAMEKNYLVLRVLPFFKNKLKEITKQPKIYFIDTGLRNIISKNFKIDGALFENYVLSELVKIGYAPKYWRTKSNAEVDFIVEKDLEIIPLEVKLKSPRKIGKSFHSFIKIYKPKKAFIVFLEGKKQKIKVGKCVVNFISFGDLEKAIY